MRYNFGPCPKCSGVLYLERGVGYTDLVCLQCGHRRSCDPGPVLLPSRRRRGRRTKAA